MQMAGRWWNQVQSWFDRRARVVLGSAGPFIGQWDLGWFKHSLPLDGLDTHIYVVGRSGKGKSKFLEGLLWQLITQGQGCGLIDPHADLANNLLKLLALQPVGPRRRPWLADPANLERVIYCESSWYGHAPVWVGIRKGIFEKHGFEVVPKAVGGSAKRIEHLEANTAQFASLGEVAMLRAMANDQKGFYWIGCQNIAPGNEGLVAIDISRIEDLRGKKIALPKASPTRGQN